MMDVAQKLVLQCPIEALDTLGVKSNYGAPMILSLSTKQVL